MKSIFRSSRRRGCLLLGCLQLVFGAAAPAQNVQSWCFSVSPDAPDASITRSDYQEIVDSIPTISTIAPVAIQSASISADDREFTASVWATTDSILGLIQRIAGVPRTESLFAGRFLPARPTESAGDVAVLGASVAAALFPDTNPIGQRVVIRDHEFQVIGVMSNVDAIQETRNRVFVLLPSPRTRIGGQPPATGSASSDPEQVDFDQLWIRVDAIDPAPTSERVIQTLARRHPGVSYSTTLLSANHDGSFESQRIPESKSALTTKFLVGLACLIGISFVTMLGLVWLTVHRLAQRQRVR